MPKRIIPLNKMVPSKIKILEEVPGEPVEDALIPGVFMFMGGGVMRYEGTAPGRS